MAQNTLNLQKHKHTNFSKTGPPIEKREAYSEAAKESDLIIN